MEKQNFEVYAVPKRSEYVLTHEQLKQLENNKDKTRAVREKNARLFEKINLRISNQIEQGYELGDD